MMNPLRPFLYENDMAWGRFGRGFFIILKIRRRMIY